ncbi:MAG: hypothetical protein QM535_03330 [Limnohabitans sp.]|nr:hypothetical protein [Limnohabitans sp.]
MKTEKKILKSYFQKGDKPTEKQFNDLIDTFLTEEEARALFDGNNQLEYTYDELKNLKESKKLVPGQKYILTDYQTKYYIEGTNSSPIVKEVTNQSVVSNYGFFATPLTDLIVGFEVEVTSLPVGYSGPITVGSITTVSANYANGYYLKFANGLHFVIGSTFRYQKQRYASIASNQTVLDTNLKPILKPNGIVNTEVHDGNAYLQMSATENPAVPTEKICLTAISDDYFSIQAESITYLGESLEYDFEDTNIKNENDSIIGTRKGLITRRVSRDKKIDVNKDWRVQRYRRYKLSEADWVNFSLSIPAQKMAVKSSAADQTLYNLNGSNACTLANISITENHKYIAPFVENANFFQDFTNLGSAVNPFLTGVTAPHFVYGGMMEGADINTYKQNVIVSTNNNAKDLFIFPLSEINEIKSLVINQLDNTVFLNLNSQYNQKNVIDVKITDGICYSTFLAGGNIYSNSENRNYSLRNIVAVDSVELRNQGIIDSLFVLASSNIKNGGDINFLTIAGMASNASAYGVTYIDVLFDSSSKIRNTIIGGKRVDRVTFNNVQTNKCLFIFSRGQYLKFSNSNLYLTCFKNGNDFYSNYISFDTTKASTKKGNLHGYLYDTFNYVMGQKIIAATNGDLIYETFSTDTNGTVNRTLTTLAISK